MLKISPIIRSEAFLRGYFTFALCITAFGISWSVYLISNSVILLSLMLLVHYSNTGNRILWNTVWRKQLDEVVQDPLLCSMIAVFFAGLLSSLWSENMKNCIWYNQMQLPFLILPLVFYAHAKSSPKHWLLILLVFLFSCLATSIWVGVDYFKNIAQYQINLLKGTPFVTHISHIRFSMIIALAAVLCFHFTGFFGPLKSRPRLRLLFRVLFLFFFGFNHLLSTKTGLLGMYLGLGLYLMVFFIQKRAYLPVLISILTLVTLLVLSVLIVPGLQNKFSYTLWQFGELSRGKWMYYSDIERWVSWKMGVEMIRHEPIMGTGIGDLYRETENVYQECLNTSLYKLPHNQFIFNWAFMGLPGLFALISVLYHSVLRKKWLRNPLILAIQSILVSSFFVEYTLGTQIGCSLYVFFTLICWVYIERMESVIGSE